MTTLQALRRELHRLQPTNLHRILIADTADHIPPHRPGDRIIIVGEELPGGL